MASSWVLRRRSAVDSVLSVPAVRSPYIPDWCLYIPAASYVTGWLEMALGAMDDG